MINFGHVHLCIRLSGSNAIILLFTVTTEPKTIQRYSRHFLCMENYMEKGCTKYF